MESRRSSPKWRPVVYDALRRPKKCGQALGSAVRRLRMGGYNVVKNRKVAHLTRFERVTSASAVVRGTLKLFSSLTHTRVTSLVSSVSLTRPTFLRSYMRKAQTVLVRVRTRQHCIGPNHSFSATLSPNVVVYSVSICLTSFSVSSANSFVRARFESRPPF
jgi:hypothetical protein